uniref:Uncharacterized protein n=1 Tax=Anguilla anguilla TaxID=7936 RepID=A0A0E9WNZ7_ANGAN
MYSFAEERSVNILIFIFNPVNCQLSCLTTPAIHTVWTVLQMTSSL